jgi:hypothetical protein
MKHGMVRLFHPTSFTWRFGFKQIWCHGRHVSHPSQRQALRWSLAHMLHDQERGCQVWKDKCSWGCKRTHPSKCTSKSRFVLSATAKNAKMFDGALGVYPHKKVHIDIDPNAKPVHSRPYPVPQIQLKTFKKELNHLVRIGVIASQQESEWVSPSFIIPKKYSRVCWISDLRQLNKVIRRKQYLLPIITDILRKHSGYKLFTKLDVSMQYYTFEVDKDKTSVPSLHHLVNTSP